MTQFAQDCISLELNFHTRAWAEAPEPIQIMAVSSCEPSSGARVIQMLNFDPVTQVGTYGLGQGFSTGEMPMWDGSPVVVSSEFPITLGVDGTGATPAADTGLLCVNKTGFKIGERRGMTLEFEKNIRTQQHTFVGSMRKSFQPMPGQGTAPVTYGYKLNA